MLPLRRPRAALRSILLLCVCHAVRAALPTAELQNDFLGTIDQIPDASTASQYLWDQLQAGLDPLIPAAVPEIVAICNNSEDARQALQWALNNKVKTYARGNGHHWAGVALADGGLTIDLSQLQGIEVDEAQNVVYVQPGVTAGQLLAALTPRGLFTSVPNLNGVGMSGYVLGGGIGDNAKVIGFGCDNAVGFEAVVARGDEVEVLTVDAQHEPELFWGLKGAGSMLALVTSITMKLHPYLPQLTMLRAPFPLDRARDVLDFWRDQDASLPADVTSSVSFAFSPQTHSPAVSLTRQVWAANGTADDASMAILEAAAEFASSNGALGPVQPMPVPYAALREVALPPNTALYSADAFLTEVDDEVISIISEVASNVTSPLSLLALTRPADATQNVDSADAAFGWRGKPYVSIMATWLRTPGGAATDGDAEHIAWARNALEQLRPYVLGRYINTVMFEDANDTRACFEPQAWQRLQQVKQSYDPYNLFRELDYYKKEEGHSATDAATDSAVSSST